MQLDQRPTTVCKERATEIRGMVTEMMIIEPKFANMCWMILRIIIIFIYLVSSVLSQSVTDIFFNEQ
jgi:hypothetical protein